MHKRFDFINDANSQLQQQISCYNDKFTVPKEIKSEIDIFKISWI